jgi:hypothetical protein
MRRVCVVGLVAATLMLAGCGGDKGVEADTRPFEAAILDYARTRSIEDRPQEFDRLDIQGSKATAKVQMRKEGDAYGVARPWLVEFEKKDGRWAVTKIER